MESTHQVPATLSTTYVWWGSMIAISVVNVLFYMFVRCNIIHEQDAAGKRYQRVLRMLALPVILSGAWMSVFPIVEVERQVLIHSPLSSILLERVLASLGALCWLSQASLVLEQLATDIWGNSRSQRVTSRFTVLMVLVGITAEVCAMVSVATTNFLYLLIATMCWCSIALLTALLALTQFCSLCAHRAPAAKRFTAGAVITALALFAYILLIVAPAYLHHWQQDQRDNVSYTNLITGLKDAAERRHQTSEWSAWKGHWLNLTLGGSLFVWSSILMAFAPRLPHRVVVEAVALGMAPLM